MKRRWTLIGLLAALALLLGVYFILQARPKSASSAIQSTSIELLKLDADKVVKMVFTRSDGTLSAEKKDKAWSFNYPYPITLNDSSVNDLVSTFSSLSAQRVVEENPTDPAQYGLKPPRATGEATLQDGTVKTLYLGDKTPTGDSYYLQAKGDAKVYSVWTYIGERFLWKIADLRDKTISPAINADEVTYLNVRERTGVVIEVLVKTEAEQASIQLGMGKYMMTRPYSYPIGLDPNKSDSFIKGPSGVQIADFVDDAPKSLASYGLDKPWGELLVRDASNTLDLQFGSGQGTDKAYFKIAGRPNVYTVYKTSLAFMDSKPFDLIDKFAFIPNIVDVDRIEISAGGTTHVLAVSRTVKKAEKQGEQDQTIETYTMDGKISDETNFKNFYQVLIGITVDGEVSMIKSGAPDVTVRYFLNKGDVRQTTLSFIPYDKDFDLAMINGKGNFALSKTKLTVMLASLEKLLKGEKVSTN
jgi:hypothetical protein